MLMSALYSISIFTTAVCPLDEAQKSDVLPFWELNNMLKFCIIQHAFPYFVYSIYVSFSLDQQTNNLDMTSCRGYVKSSLSCLWKIWQGILFRGKFVINHGCSLTISVGELTLMDVSVSSFSTASTSPLSAASCNFVFFCRILLQVTLSISSLVLRLSLPLYLFCEGRT